MSANDHCPCRRCVEKRHPYVLSPERQRPILCHECGNKRCPHASSHENACTGSNEPGQEGSDYA